MSHPLIHGARPEEMDVIAKLTTAGERTAEPIVLGALGEGLELIRRLIIERELRQEFDGQWDEPGDDTQWDAPAPDE
jgi:hypothetical protein